MTSNLIVVIVFWILALSIPILLCWITYRLIARRGYPKMALLVSILVLLGIIILYNFIPIG